MPVKLQLSFDKLDKLKTSCLVLSFSEETVFAKDNLRLLNKLIGKKLIEQAKAEGFKAKLGQTFLARTTNKTTIERILLQGLGKKANLDEENIRRAFAKGYKELAAKSLKEISLVLPQLKNKVALQQVVEGLLLANYKFSKYLSKEESGGLKKITLLVGDSKEKTEANKQLKRTTIITAAVYLCRDLINEPAQAKTPPLFIKKIEDLLKESNNLKLKILTARELETEGLNGLRAVAAGSKHAPALVEISYQASDKVRAPLCLIGKGVTFDAGGLNIKNRRQMLEMKSDMSGAAVALATIIAVSQLKLKLSLKVLLPLTENLLGEEAYKPGDILKMKNNKTVEIIDTDAEGRLILADALCYAQRYKPLEIIELSTLTGGVAYALGNLCAGFFSDNEPLAKRLIAAAKMSGEKLWQLPLIEDYRAELKGAVSDLRNIGKSTAGTITAALFLTEFAGQTPFAHIDIGGTAFLEEKSEIVYLKQGASGYGTRLLIDYLIARSG